MWKALLGKNKSTREYLSFLGAGCWQHQVPAVCDEINSRGEFLTAYAGDPYEDHGRFQALFEYESMMGELLNMDVVNVPNYDGFQAAATALRMAGRITGRETCPGGCYHQRRYALQDPRLSDPRPPGRAAALPAC